MSILNKNKKIVSCLMATSIISVVGAYYSVSSKTANAYLNDRRIENEVSSGGLEYNGDFLIDEKGKLLDYKGISSVEVKIPDSVKVIGEYAFANHGEINSVIFPENLIEIERYAFSGCIGLVDVNIPDSVETIGRLAFSGCTNMRIAHLGKGVKKIGEMSFWLCSSLKKIDVSEENNIFASYKGVLYDKNFDVLIKCPQGFTGKFVAFKKVKKVCEYAFAGCSKLDKILFEDGVEVIGEAAFFNCNSLMKVYLGESLISIGACAFADCLFLDTVELPRTVRSIGSSAFYGCRSLHNVFIKANDVNIDTHAFKGCSYDFYIKGYENSAVQEYAQREKIDFMAVK